MLGRLSFGLAAHPNLELDGKNRKQAVALLLESVNTTIDAPPPGWLAYTFGQIPANLPLSKDALRKFQNARNKLRREQRQDLKRWWFHQIATGRSPVAERLVLFWHNFFTTEINMLPNPAMSWQQQLVLRQHALGNYRHLLRAMNQDPALLWYLDNHLNKKKKPNENYARELLELYTLGEGNYSEGDIKELARTMTGAGVDSASWTYLFRRGQHDNAEKTFLGTRGNLHPDQVIDIILRQKQASEYLVRRLWTEFVSPLPDQKIVAEMAAVFRRHDYELKPLLQALFEHPAFWASENRMTLVKSPVELLVGTHLSAGKPVDDYKKAVIALAEMGQDLFNPPDVGGWPAGKEWINSVRLARRHQYQIGVAEPSPSQLKLDYQLK
ncbi:MAG: DUF1800 domain-containing protein [Granulosicoccaceae bacterium]